MTANNLLIEALVKAQMEIKPPKKDATNAGFKSKYVTIDMIYEAVRIPLAKNGLTLSHGTEYIDGKYFLKTMLYHVSGEKIENTVPMFIDKITSQGFGSAMTYSRRYAICSLLGLPSEEDDDGNQATAQQSAKQKTEETQAKPTYNSQKTLSAEQIQTIDELLGEDMSLLNYVLDDLGKNRFSEVPAEKFGYIIYLIKKQRGIK